MQRFRGRLVLKAHRLCVSLNYRLESDQEEEEEEWNQPHDSGSEETCSLARSLNKTLIDSQDLSGRGAARAEEAQETPTQSHVSPSILVYED